MNERVRRVFALATVACLCCFLTHSDGIVLDADFQPSDPLPHERILLVGIQCSLVACPSCKPARDLTLYGKTVPVLARMWRKVTNQRERGLGGLSIYIRTLLMDVKSDPNQVWNATEAMVAQGVQAMLAPEGLLSVQQALHSEASGIPVITGMSGSIDLFMCRPPLSAPCTDTNGSRRFKYLFGVMTPGSVYFQPIFPMAAQNGLNTIAAVWGTTDPTLEDVCMGSIPTAYDVDMQLVYSKRLATTVVGDLTAFKQEIAAVVQTLKQMQPDVVLFCYREACQAWLETLEQYDYFPPMHGTFECGNYNGTYLRYAQHVITPVQWDPRVRGTRFTDDPDPLSGSLFPNVSLGSSAEQFYNMYNNMSAGAAFSSLSSSEAASMTDINLAVGKCNCTDASGIYDSLKKAPAYSFFGLLSSNKIGMNELRDIILVQVDRYNQTQIVAPQTTGAKYKPVIPAPTWKERTYAPNVYGSFEETLVIGLSATFSAVNVLVAAAWILCRHTPVVKAKSVWLTVITLCGGILLFNAPLL